MSTRLRGSVKANTAQGARKIRVGHATAPRFGHQIRTVLGATIGRYGMRHSRRRRAVIRLGEPRGGGSHERAWRPSRAADLACDPGEDIRLKLRRLGTA